MNSETSFDGSRMSLENGEEVAVVYFRAGYTPNDYPSEAEWEGRVKIERSMAVKCPSIAYHLVGTKKVRVNYVFKILHELQFTHLDPTSIGYSW